MKALILVLALSGATSASTQDHQHHHGAGPHNPYAGFVDRQIKALSPEQVSELQEGRGMGASLPAELNGVPGPVHVLELKEQLGVTPQQLVRLEGISSEMQVSAKRLGLQVIDEEGRLEQAFRAGKSEEATVQQLTARIGDLNGQLRSVHLLAHLRTRDVLTPQQVQAYSRARGYTQAADVPVHR